MHEWFINQNKLKTVTATILMLLLNILLISCSYGFIKSGGNVAWTDWNEGTGKNVYYLASADPKTFKVLAKHTYAKDQKHVWYMTDIVDGADAESFKVLSDTDYGKDKNRVFMHQVVIKNADPETFKLLKSYYSRDKSRVFCGTVAMDVHDIDSFEVIMATNGFQESPPWHIIGWGGWARDGVAYYFGANEIKLADYSSFVVLNEYYAKDKNRVYYKEHTVFEADPATFKVISLIEGKDKNHKYSCGQIDTR